MNEGDRILYVGRREKYKGLLGTVRSLGNPIGSFFVKFDNDDGELFFHLSDFLPSPAVDELAQLARFVPTSADIGRGVVYSPSHGPTEDGVLTSFNTIFAFVRYAEDSHSKATRPDDLRWLAP